MSNEKCDMRSILFKLPKSRCWIDTLPECSIGRDI